MKTIKILLVLIVLLTGASICQAANEIVFGRDSGDDYFAIAIRKADFYVWYPTGTAWEAWGTGSRDLSDYGMAASEQGDSGIYTVTFTQTNASIVRIYSQAGGSPAVTDIYDGAFDWPYNQVDLIQIGTVSQSVTDLKDFADTGYDPATHSVVLVNTTTANTDLVTAAAVVNEWETQSQADPNGFQVNVITVNSVATNLNELMDAADTDKVVTDSVIGKVASTDGDWSKFVKTTDALQSNRDKLPANLEDLSITDTTGIVKSNVTWWRDSSVLANAINGMPLVDIGAINGIVSHATNLEAITTYLMANALTTLGDEIADNSILAKLMAADGDISDYNPATDAQESIINSLATVGGYIDDILKLSEADTKIDKTTDPDAWRIIFYEKGTANVLMTKLIKSVDGTAVKSEYTVIGQQVEAP